MRPLPRDEVAREVCGGSIAGHDLHALAFLLADEPERVLRCEPREVPQIATCDLDVSRRVEVEHWVDVPRPALLRLPRAHRQRQAASQSHACTHCVLRYEVASTASRYLVTTPRGRWGRRGTRLCDCGRAARGGHSAPRPTADLRRRVESRRTSPPEPLEPAALRTAPAASRVPRRLPQIAARPLLTRLPAPASRTALLRAAVGHLNRTAHDLRH